LRSPSDSVENLRLIRCAQRGEFAPDQVRAAERVEQFHRPGHIGGLVLLLPPAEDRVRRGEHEVDDLLARRHPLGQRRAGEADPRPQVEDVHVAETLAQDLDGALSRVEQGRRDLKQGGLARPVRPDHDPALILMRGPVDVPQQQ
jgi:hypothetical protein